MNNLPIQPVLVRTIGTHKWNQGMTHMFLQNVESIVVETHGGWEFSIEKDDTDTDFVFFQTKFNNNLLVSQRNLFSHNITPDF